MSSQDFTKKIVIVVRQDLESWQVLNTIAHLAAYLGNKMKDRFDTGDYFVTSDGKKHSRNCQFPIIVLAAKSTQMKDLIAKVRAANLLYLGFIREMIETTDDEQIAKIMAGKQDVQIEYLGVGMFGGHEQLKALTKNFSLWK